MAETGVVAAVPSDLIAFPYEKVAVGAAANLPALPDTFHPVAGIRLPHGAKSTIYRLVRVPLGSTLTTGVTVEVAFCIDPNANNADISGSKVFLEATIGPITSGTSILDDTVLTSCTATTAQTAALPTAVGKVFVQAIAMANAKTNSLAVGNWALLRVRRLGDNASDTNTGIIVLLGLEAYAY